MTYKYVFQKLTNNDVLIGFPYRENRVTDINNRLLLKAEKIGRFISHYSEENSPIDAMLVDPKFSTSSDVQILSNSKKASVQLLQIKFLGKGQYRNFTNDKFIKLLKRCLKYGKNEISLLIFAEGSFSVNLQAIVDWLDKIYFPFRDVIFIYPNKQTGNMEFYPLKNSYHDLNPIAMSESEILREY